MPAAEPASALIAILISVPLSLTPSTVNSRASRSIRSANLCKIFFRCAGAILDHKPFSHAVRADFIALFMSATVARAIEVNGLPSIGETISKFSPVPLTQSPSINNFCGEIFLYRCLLIKFCSNIFNPIWF